MDMNQISSMLIICSFIFLYFTYKRLPNVNNMTKEKIKDVQFTVAMSAMKELALTKIALDTSNSRNLRKEAMYHLKRIDLQLYDKIVRKYHFLKLKVKGE